ncbi:MAG: sulfatase [Labilithrix sp.]
MTRAVATVGLVWLFVQCSGDDTAPGKTGSSSGGAGSSSSSSGGAPDGGPSAEGGAARGKPNIVFILADDLALNLLPFMPHVLEMQKNGLTFVNYFVSDSLCCPSRSSIYTGRFPHDTGVFTNGGDDGGYAQFKKMGNETATFGSALQNAGYRTMMMGKYLNGYEPVAANDAGTPVPPGWTEWAVAGAAYKELNYDLNQTGTVHHYGKADTDYLTDVIAGLGVGFVKADVGKPSAQPFLLEMATFAPHSPFTPAPRDVNLFPGLVAPRTPAFDAAPDADAVTWLKATPALTKVNKDKIDANFRERAQAVQAIDKAIGDLQAAVAAAGQADNTYFVFSSDNGFHMGEHSLRPGKQTAFDTDIHVPLIVTGPGVPKGAVADQIAQNVDLCSTFAELGGGTPIATQNGHSLVALLRGETPADWRTAALIEHHGSSFDPTDPDAPEELSGDPPTYNALRTKDVVYIEYAGGEVEYHDRRTDPDELHNTAKALTAGQKAALHTTLEAMKTCHDPAACWAAQHLAPGAP